MAVNSKAGKQVEASELADVPKLLTAYYAGRPDASIPQQRAAAIFYLFQHRPMWGEGAAVGRRVVSSQMIDHVTAKLDRKLYEAPVGFKWFVDGLLDGSHGFSSEESAGASFVHLDGSVWTTDMDGIVPALLAEEITARMDRDPGEIYRELTCEFSDPREKS